jgi:hypothetical protein
MDAETLICDATGCRYERSPAGDRAETERAPVSLFFFLQKMPRSCQRLAFCIVIHGFARFSRLYEKQCISGSGPNLYFTKRLWTPSCQLEDQTGGGVVSVKGCGR